MGMVASLCTPLGHPARLFREDMEMAKRVCAPSPTVTWRSLTSYTSSPLGASIHLITISSPTGIRQIRGFVRSSKERHRRGVIRWIEPPNGELVYDVRLLHVTVGEGAHTRFAISMSSRKSL